MVDKGLMISFVERLHRKTQSFHLPFEEMTLTLDDVSSLLHISIIVVVFTLPMHPSVNLFDVSIVEPFLEMNQTKGCTSNTHLRE